MNQGLEQSDTDSFQDSSLKLNVRSGGGGGGGGGGGQSRSSSLLSESSSQPEVHPFFKDSFGKFIVLYSYYAQDENDLSVERGQLVTLLNKVKQGNIFIGLQRKIFTRSLYRTLHCTVTYRNNWTLPISPLLALHSSAPHKTNVCFHILRQDFTFCSRVCLFRHLPPAPSLQPFSSPPRISAHNELTERPHS